MSNRLRLVYISMHSWMSYVTNHRQVRCLNMPREARVERVIASEQRYGRDVVVWLSSPDFDELGEGAVIPEFQLLFEEVQ